MTPDENPAHILHRWHYFDPIRQRRITTRHDASEAHARAMVERGEWIDPHPLPGTRVVRRPRGQDAWHTTGAFAGSTGRPA